MPPAILLRDTVSLLGRYPVLAGLDLRVEDGEIVLLRGPNGAGKTSLLRTCAGLLRVASGTATVLGHDLCVDRRTVRPQIGLLGHATGLYDDLTVLDNLQFWARAVRADRPDATVDAALDRVALAERLRSVAVARLSSGQRRRVSLAAMIVRRPRLWLLDEPHAGLDAEGRDLLDAMIAEAAASGATVLFASHELDRAVAVASRCVTIAGGVVVADDAA
ncbi:MAG TPA: heme ABC exporter ATP-binding protein CcmA [Microthrixaceae bacterium]|nr:heme ABC exporter ATP-binding protein CcmA [Microthrixaceae bacterium]